MARTRSRAISSLVALGAILALIFGAIALGSGLNKGAHWTPRLALDLAGGTQIVLTPVPTSGQQANITSETIQDAIKIIRQRVDSSGVSESEISAQGSNNIVVSLPGDPKEQAEAIKLVSQSAQMSFRPVLHVEQSAPVPAATPSPTASPSGSATAKPSASASTTVKPSSTAKASTSNRVLPQVLKAPSASPSPSPTPTEHVPGVPATAGGPAPSNASDLAWITNDIAVKFKALNCADPANRTGGTESDPTKPLVTCSQDGTLKYILGPVELRGDQLSSAAAAMGQDQRGNPTGQWVVNIAFNNVGTQIYSNVTKRIVAMQQPQNQLAVVLDDLVVIAPTQEAAITDGKAQISGNFSREEASTLGSQLKFGALPISFKVQTQEQISALLGSQQLQSGLLAGLIGLALVAIYSLLQYRALGLVTIASLLVAGLLTYGVTLLLSWTQGYRLSLPGVAGMIVAIGVTADSFIVYFERIRDEVRDGRALPSAVERAWARARRTILVSDLVNLVAAVVLYVLAVGGVRGFAFTLGLTTIIDLLVVVLFTHPIVGLLARTEFFGNGHKMSGFGPDQLGRYVGRGQVRTPVVDEAPQDAVDTDDADDTASDDDADPKDKEPVTAGRAEPPRRLTIAERKAAAAKAAQAGTETTGKES